MYITSALSYFLRTYTGLRLNKTMKKFQMKGMMTLYKTETSKLNDLGNDR